MDKTFQKFLRSGIDLSPVGVERREGNNPYFCTPKGASIFGWGRRGWYPLLLYTRIRRYGLCCQSHEFRA